MRSVFVLVAALALVPSLVRAQQTVSHDTLSDASPVAVTCGFCEGEAFGAVFRELPAPLDGIDPEDFPLELQAVEIAIASSRTVGSGGAYRCEGDSSGGTIEVGVEIWAGTTVPSGDIRGRPIAEPWSEGEVLVWASDVVPVDLSVPEVDGSAMYTLRLNTIMLADESGGTLRVPAPASYLRVLVWLPGGGASTACDAMGIQGPGGSPVRDDDGRIATERSYLYASGAGFLWNEQAGVNGDWAIRLQVLPAPAGRRDGGVALDGGVIPGDAGASSSDGGDAGGSELPAPSGGGRGCRANGASGALPPPLVALASLAIVVIRRRRCS